MGKRAEPFAFWSARSMELNIGLYPFVYIISLLFGLGLGKKKYNIFGAAKYL